MNEEQNKDYSWFKGNSYGNARKDLKRLTLREELYGTRLPPNARKQAEVTVQQRVQNTELYEEEGEQFSCQDAADFCKEVGSLEGARMAVNFINSKGEDMRASVQNQIFVNYLKVETSNAQSEL